jgi:hypothetical protein
VSSRTTFVAGEGSAFSSAARAGDPLSARKRLTLTLGIAVDLFAGILQGTFILSMNHTCDWKWEHNWFVFSLLGTDSWIG